MTAESINASQSFKYFGKGQGVSAYTFTDDRNFLWYSTVFSAAERESAYVIDGLMHNDVVKSDVHSTDTHGYSEAIFATAHLLGISYAPRIKTLKRQTLYAFRSTPQETRKAWAVQPQKYVDEAIIRDHWEDILRLVVTIKLKKTTASDIFRRLNSYSKQNSLYTALKAFGRIVKTLFILRYTDDVALRMAIEAQLNRIELANRFTRAVAVGNPREFAYAHQEDQQGRRSLQPADQKRRHLLELSLSRDAPQVDGARSEGGFAPGHQSPFPHVMGAYQHARRVRLLRRKARRQLRDPPPKQGL